MPQPWRAPALTGGALILLALALIAGSFLLVPSDQLPRSTADPVVTRGPVGWEPYRDLGELARMRPGEQLRQFSSYDRTGWNDDGFNGTYSCLRKTSTGCVIAEAQGAGEVASIWFTYAQFSTLDATGLITIVLDGRTVVRRSLRELVDGAAGAPFVWPLVGNPVDTMGGAVIKVPMPFRQSMLITTQHNPHFYHVTYRKFDDATGVPTFDPSDRALDVIERLRGFGVRDPKQQLPGQVQQSAVELAPGAAMAMPVIGGPRQITELSLRLPQVVTGPRVLDDGRAFGPRGGSSFTARVDPVNTGVRITRRYDAKISHQRAWVAVDGQRVGEWRNGGSLPGTWADQAVEVPLERTIGKSVLRISSTFRSSSKDVNEFRYDVHSKIGGQWVLTDTLNVGPNNPQDEAAHGYRITARRWAGLGDYRYRVSAQRAAKSERILGGLRLRVSFDGRRTVDAPIGDFFGSGLGKYDTRTVLHAIDTSPGGAFTSWWPMPFARSATVELVNHSGLPVRGAGLSVRSAANPSLTATLAAGGSHGYFHATHRRANTVHGEDWNFLTAGGAGVVYGVSTSMRGHIGLGNVHQMAYLEGDERIYVDGAATPNVIGTGSEDFYESGWYFLDPEADRREGVPYAMPLAGVTGSEAAQEGCANVCLGAYRLMISDAVPFGRRVVFDIEHGWDSDLPADYSSVTYWYGRPAPTLIGTDLIDLDNGTSRSRHRYVAVGERSEVIRSTFEGKLDRSPMTRRVTSASGHVKFNVALSADNRGMRLIRLGDQAAARQRARVFVDDKFVGVWYQPLGNRHSRWLEDSFDVPASVVTGKGSATVRLEPAAGTTRWSAARYRVVSRVAGG